MPHHFHGGHWLCDQPLGHDLQQPRAVHADHQRRVSWGLGLGFRAQGQTWVQVWVRASGLIEASGSRSAGNMPYAGVQGCRAVPC